MRGGISNSNTIECLTSCRVYTWPGSLGVNLITRHIISVTVSCTQAWTTLLSNPLTFLTKASKSVNNIIMEERSLISRSRWFGFRC